MFIPQDTSAAAKTEWYAAEEEVEMEEEPTVEKPEYVHMGNNREMEKNLMETRNRLQLTEDECGRLQKEIIDLKNELVAKDVIFEQEIDRLMEAVTFQESEPPSYPVQPVYSQYPTQQNPSQPGQYNQAPAYTGFRFH